MTSLDDVKSYITDKFATDIAAPDLPDDIDLIATGILSSLSTVQLLGWCGRTFRVPINSISIDPAQLRTPLNISAFIDAHRADVTTEGCNHVR
jgi:acyl carrier protein